MTDAEREALFRTWLATYGPAVTRVARAYTTRVDDARDLAQEILMQVWRSLPNFGGRADPATWCYRVALNTALGHHRHEARRRRHQRPLLDAGTLPDPHPADAPGDERPEVVARLYDAIRQLPGTDAALILLHLDGLSYRQIAEVLGITESNVGVKLTRARTSLRALMPKEQAP